ncbi:hypothetical protein SIID45300_01355 [Candidatus Magnetaquicoccaceae bacterium FCR-1]|uniref:RloB domain-containing protein n=2 Tax=Candidatus Magnetaquiglobus chichijimensis TaxID=3141448 RepID=A0ABQ0C8L2_9PROT
MVLPKNAFQNRQRDLIRHQGKRHPYDRILIVTEGTKTEPFYLEEIRRLHRPSSPHIHVRPCESGTSPHQIVEDAEKLFHKGDPSNKKIKARSFDKIYVVFDRDEHEHYDEALHRARDLDGHIKNDEKKWIPFKAIPSIPCFELWLLLHFQEVHAPLHRNEAKMLLRGHIPDYEKGMKTTFADTRKHLDVALSRAKRLAERTTPDNPEQWPYTAMHELVEELLKNARDAGQTV